MGSDRLWIAQLVDPANSKAKNLAKSSDASECIIKAFLRQLMNPVTVCVKCPKRIWHNKTIFYTDSQYSLAKCPCSRHFCI